MPAFFRNALRLKLPDLLPDIAKDSRLLIQSRLRSGATHARWDTECDCYDEQCSVLGAGANFPGEKGRRKRSLVGTGPGETVDAIGPARLRRTPSPACSSRLA